MADFNQAFQLVIAHEGGYVNDPDDPGGETYKGVARKIHSKWEGWQNIDILKRQPDFQVISTKMLNSSRQLLISIASTSGIKLKVTKLKTSK